MVDVTKYLSELNLKLQLTSQLAFKCEITWSEINCIFNSVKTKPTVTSEYAGECDSSFRHLAKGFRRGKVNKKTEHSCYAKWILAKTQFCSRLTTQTWKTSCICHHLYHLTSDAMIAMTTPPPHMNNKLLRGCQVTSGTPMPDSARQGSATRVWPSQLWWWLSKKFSKLLWTRCSYSQCSAQHCQLPGRADALWRYNFPTELWAGSTFGKVMSIKMWDTYRLL